MQSEIENLTRRVAEQAGNRCGARLLMTHPGVGPVTALATEVFLGDPQRFADSKTLASYVGIIPREYSSGEHQRLGGGTQQGSPLLRVLWGDAGAHAGSRGPRANGLRKVGASRAWRWHASWESGCGSCCGMRLIIKSSVVADRYNRKQ